MFEDLSHHSPCQHCETGMAQTRKPCRHATAATRANHRSICSPGRQITAGRKKWLVTT